MTRSTDKGRNRPPAVAFLLDMARLSLKAEQLPKLRVRVDSVNQCHGNS